METTRAVEDYLKAIYALGSQGGVATNAGVAERLGVSPPSVSAMVKRLRAAALVTRPSSGEIALTEGGEAAALRMVRRHRLLEAFLYRMLDVPWDEVHDEAEILEHAVSDRLEERIAVVLGDPTHDPHGDPIPPRDGTHRERLPGRLDDARESSLFLVERVSDRDPGILRYLATIGIRPGTVIGVEQRAPFDGPLWVRVDDARHALGRTVGRSVFGSEAAGLPAADSGAGAVRS